MTELYVRPRVDYTRRKVIYDNLKRTLEKDGNIVIKIEEESSQGFLFNLIGWRKMITNDVRISNVLKKYSIVF